MSPFAALALLPLWAVSLAVAFTAIRMARRLASGLVLLCVTMSGWVTGLLLLDSPGAAPWAERLLPSGMLLAGAFVQAGAELSGRRHRGVVALAWAGSAAVALLGLLAPRWLYGEGARGAGPLFVPLAILSTVGTLSAKRWLWSLVRAAPPGVERRRRAALFVANVFGALGGGGAIALHITGFAPAGIAVPFLLVSIAMAAFAVWSGEERRGRELLSQGMVLAGTTALLSVPGLLLFYVALPNLVPGGDPFSAWGAVVVLLAAFPLETLRQLVAERVIERLFRRPAVPRAMVTELERQEVRADHAERLAELGRVASAVAHEVRNPLGVILAEAKLLEREGASPESLEAIRAQVARASRFVDDLLRYARPNPLALREIDVAAAVREAADAVRRVHPGARIALELPERLYVEADANAVSDIVTNLLTNAAIATDGTPGEIRVTAHSESGDTALCVEDDGPGVPGEILPRLFLPFVTGRGRDARSPGTGLGLALSLRLAERQGATLHHERPAAGGARFVMRWSSTRASSS